MIVVKAAAVQISPVLYSREGTLQRVVQKILELGKLLRLLDQAVTVPSAATQAIGEAARQAKMVVSIGINERDGGTLYNTQLLFNADGNLIQRRRKIAPMGSRRRLRATRRGQRGWPHRSVGMLGALQSAGPLRPDGRRRTDPFGDVSRFIRGRTFRRADAGQYSPARP